MNLSGLLSDSIGLVADLVGDIEKGVKAGGSAGMDVIQIAEALWSDADFKAKVVAIIADIKG